ncbi:MAG: metallophosphoesterase family protein [Alphaproteobacteria bacterium]|nr:metallophosphoesterase family protein [Alphaproteobacteria bacterium]
MSFTWAHSHTPFELHAVAPGGTFYVISDIHLGDGGPTDIFLAKDRHLLRFIDKVDEEDATLIVAGDAIDFSQAWDLTRILRAHGKVLGAFSRLAAKGRMIYVLGNHDYDLKLYQDLLNIPVVQGVRVGQDVCITHGYEYDPVIGPDLHVSEWKTRFHHIIERAVGAWIRLPLQHFYNFPNRVAFWMFHKAILLGDARGRFLQAVTGDDSFLRKVHEEANYWTRAQLGDPGSLFHPIMEALEAGPYRVLVCGHSHLPGVVESPTGRVYANTGSWTFNSSTYLRIDDEGIELKDWLSGKRYDDRLYRPIMEGRLDSVGFLEWWERHYRGFLRFAITDQPPPPRPGPPSEDQSPSTARSAS